LTLFFLQEAAANPMKRTNKSKLLISNELVKN
jgi:hypothetical protein